MAWTPITRTHGLLDLCAVCGNGRGHHGLRDDRCPGYSTLPEGQELRLVPIHRCDCTHLPGEHDPITGACLATSASFGPCPCLATPQATLHALWTAWSTQTSVKVTT